MTDKVCVDCKHHRKTWLGRHRCHRRGDYIDKVTGERREVDTPCGLERRLGGECGILANHFQPK